MSLFDDNLVEQTMYVRHAYDINITSFTPDVFYKWIWKEKGVDYPPRLRTISVDYQLLNDILIDKLGDIPADDFIKWQEEIIKMNHKKYFRRYFKKLVKRKYMPSFSVYLAGEEVRVVLPYAGVFGTRLMSIIFHRR